MAKRNKKKLKKILRAQINSQAVQTPTSPAVEYSVADTEVAAQPEVKNVAVELQDEEVKEVKHEIRKILLTVFALVVIVLVIYFVNIKTDIILKAGEVLTRALNVSV